MKEVEIIAIGNILWDKNRHENIEIAYEY